GNVDRALGDADAEPLADGADVLRRADDVGAGAAEAGAAYHRGAVAGVEVAQAREPLYAELGRRFGRDFDDQAFHENLRAPHVELVDDLAQAAVQRFGRGD